MKQKKIIFIIIIILLAIPFFTLGQTPLEVDYPTTPEGEAPFGVETTTIAQYVRYIYNISFGIAAIIAFVAFIYAGFLYLSSAGNPNKIKEAKDRIFSALLGIGILLISYILLVMINPETIMLITPRLEDIGSSEYTPSLREIRSGTLGTVKEIGIMGQLAMEGIDDLGSDIFDSALFCNCFITKGLCLCTGGEESDDCEPKVCYASEDDDGHPCSDYDEMKENQELMIFWLDELIYYQNKAIGTDVLSAAGIEEAEEEIINNLIENIMNGNFDNLLEDTVNAALAGYLGGEAKSLQKEIADISYPTVIYYEEYIESLEEEQPDPRTIQTLNEILNREEEKLELKQDLVLALIEFSFLVEAMKIPINELAHLTEQCALNTQQECTPQCFGECHDTYIGCQAICTGLNPCPIIDIAIAWGELELIQGVVMDVTEEIVELVDDIRQLER